MLSPGDSKEIFFLFFLYKNNTLYTECRPQDVTNYTIRQNKKAHNSESLEDKKHKHTVDRRN